ncbi:MAG: DUF4838 domain-containing protein, partial [Clostridia bacterium]|nr:DUF4838 domain-containing protein [Clostridia bacterium]
GLDPQVEDSTLDDVIYFDCDAEGGIIAGSNPRSVLLAVYRYLKGQGCNWLFPGPDGESIPLVEGLVPLRQTHKASYRYRGQCNEGTETQPTMLQAIEFTPKVGLNTFMIEFDIPKNYYQRGYAHRYSNIPAEAPLSDATVLQWKRQCETEIARRGLLYHDMGHGWTAEPFGFDSTEGWVRGSIPADADLSHLAMIDGVREFFGGIALNTNLCMSNPETRRIVARAVADYAEKQNNVDFLHVWLADAYNNHCECENCARKDTSDWYVILLNDINAELTVRNLDTHIVFIAYVDTTWAPETEKILNEKRFTMLYAPITRKYTETYEVDADPSKLVPYCRNKLTLPQGMAENLAYLAEWKKMWKGECFCYEYYFWKAQYLDIGSVQLAKTIYGDIQGLKKHGLSGIVEDGSQRSYFPTGFLFYVYGETLYDSSKTFEQLTEEYFSAAFGEDWRIVYDYLEKLSYTSDFGYCKGEREKVNGTRYYDPSLKPRFEEIGTRVEAFKSVIEAHLAQSVRTRYVSWELLKWHTNYAEHYAKAFACLCTGDTEGATQEFFEMMKDLAPLEPFRPQVYDHELAMKVLSPIFASGKTVSYNEVFFG